MKHINQLLHECIERIDRKVARERQSQAHKAGIAEARRILAEPSTYIPKKQEAA